MLSKSVPAEKMGVYMGVFNMFIVIPQIVSMIVLPLIYKPVLGNSPSNALFFAGTMLFIGGIVSWRLRLKD
jgi:maltose/moltooligosaccharide transporter